MPLHQAEIDQPHRTIMRGPQRTDAARRRRVRHYRQSLSWHTKLLDSLTRLLNDRQDMVDAAHDMADAAFTGLLQIHSLKHLDLSHCQGFTQSAAAALAAAYVPGAIPTTTKIRSLTVRGWKLDTDSMQLLRHLPFLQTLVTDAGTEQLTK